MSTTNKKIAELLTEAAGLSTQAADLARRGKVEQALKLEQRADELRAQARQTGKTPTSNKRSTRQRAEAQDEPRSKAESSESTRNLTITSLVEIGVPSSPRAVAEYALLRFGKSFDHRSLASLRRDELRAWSSPKSARSVYVVPALEGSRFFAFRGKVALSNWALGRRLIGPWSERVDHLVTTRNLAKQLAWLTERDAAAGKALERLVGAYASTIPGAISGTGKLLPEQVEAAVEAELQVIGPRDKEWRKEAEERALAVLTESEQLWGTKPPGLVKDSSA